MAELTCKTLRGAPSDMHLILLLCCARGLRCHLERARSFLLRRDWCSGIILRSGSATLWPPALLAEWTSERTSVQSWHRAFYFAFLFYFFLVRCSRSGGLGKKRGAELASLGLQTQAGQASSSAPNCTCGQDEERGPKTGCFLSPCGPKRNFCWAWMKDWCE